MKKLLLTGIIAISTIGYISALGVPGADNDFYYQDVGGATPIEPGDTATEASILLAEQITTDSINESESLMQQFLSIFRLSDTTWFMSAGNDTAIAYVRMIVNMVLGLVSFVALALTIYAFYLLFFVQQEQGTAKAKKILTGVGIAIAIIGLSRFIVSFIFWLQQRTLPGA